MSVSVDIVASGALAERLPEGSRGGRARLDIAPDTSLAALLAGLGIAPERPLLTLLNGAVVVPSERATTLLADGDSLALAPPIRAG